MEMGMMETRSIDQFLKHIDEARITGWRLEDDCHPKIKKLVLEKKYVLRGISTEKEIRLTLERARGHTFRGHNPGPAFDKKWELPEDYQKHGTLQNRPEIMKEISEHLKHPIYNGRRHYYRGEHEIL